MIKISTRQFIALDDFDKLVVEAYQRPYSFQQQDGSKERGKFHLTVPFEAEDFERDEVNGDEMGVSFAAWLAKNLPSNNIFAKNFWHRRFYPDVQMVANDLHAKGLFPGVTTSLKVIGK